LKKLTLLGTALLVLTLIGCGSTINQTSSEGLQSTPSESTPINKKNEVIIASRKFDLQVNSDTLHSSALLTQNILSSIISLNISVPEIIELSLSGELSFNDITLGEQLSTTPLQLGITFNDVLKYEKVIIRLRTLNDGGEVNEGLVGEYSDRFTLLIKMSDGNQEFQSIPNSGNYIDLYTFNVANSIVKEKNDLMVMVDFNNAAKQPYSTQILVEVIGVVPADYLIDTFTFGPGDQFVYEGHYFDNRNTDYFIDTWNIVSLLTSNIDLQDTFQVIANSEEYSSNNELSGTRNYTGGYFSDLASQITEEGLVNYGYTDDYGTITRSIEFPAPLYIGTIFNAVSESDSGYQSFSQMEAIGFENISVLAGEIKCTKIKYISKSTYSYDNSTDEYIVYIWLSKDHGIVRYEAVGEYPLVVELKSYRFN
jgi:hypothetical protein